MGTKAGDCSTPAARWQSASVASPPLRRFAHLRPLWDGAVYGLHDRVSSIDTLRGA